MPVPANTPAELLPAAAPLVMRSRGRNASDEAVAAGRISAYLGEADWAPLGELIRECRLTPREVAALVRCGALRLHTETAVGRCERCSRQSSTPLCDSCRGFLLGERADTPGEAPRLRGLRRRTDAAPSTRARGMHVHR